MDSTKHEVLADTIGVESEVEARRRFWLAHMRMGFGIFLLETLVVMSYLYLTPDGPHRTLLWPIIMSWAVCAAVGVLIAPIVTGRSWRSTYSVTWTVASTYAVGLVALLDTGVNSPILLLLYLPLVYAALMFSPRSALLCGVSTLVVVGVVAGVDRHFVAAEGWISALFGTLAGAAALSVAAAINRCHVEQHEERLLAQLAELAGTDELTGCAVRRVLRQRAEEEIERALRTGSPLGLLMIDVDQFKSVNDNFGHVVGDRVLAAIGRILLDTVRPFDVASRVGGDEFALLLPETDAAGAVQVAERIFRELAGTGEVPVTLSIGVSSLDRSMPTVERLFDEADMALYQVKRAGRDAIAVQAPGSPTNSW
ncbi:MAG TPA: GGDEF domain-containing protein [Acidimicrobiales bacterium]